MKLFTIGLLLLIPALAIGQQDFAFDRYFADQTLRIDYFHTGDAKTEEFCIDRIYKQGPWAGNPDKCIQPFELGLYKVSVFDIATNKIIYSKGYNSIFAEYQTIDPAIKGIKKTYHESVLIPLPRKPFKLIIEKRNRYNLTSPVYILDIDPADYHIIHEDFASGTVTIPIVASGNPHKKVDLVILSEGYKKEELDQFKSDLKYYTDLFFTVDPYKTRKDLFNVTGVFSASVESGTDEPRQGIYRNTRMGSTFNYFDLDRYCLADDNKSIRDVAASVPYDAILIMVNRNRYGGGGIYNWQTVFNTGSDARDYVFLHEFGHAFAGLADEYFAAQVAYVDFYTTGVEPLEPNITASTDRENIKWKEFLSPGIDVPTDWNKEVYDSLMNAQSALEEERQRVISNMQSKGSPASEIEKVNNDFYKRSAILRKQIDDFFANHPLKDKVGVFEGANYMSKGMYRPTIMSLMHRFEKGHPSYDIVNEQVLIKTIEYYTGN